MEKLEISEKRIEGEIVRRAEEERKLKEKINRMDRKMQDMEEENKKLKEQMRRLEVRAERSNEDVNVLKLEEVDRKKTLVLKNGRNWSKEERVGKWISRHIGEVDFELKKMEKGQQGIQWIVFKENFIKEYLWHKKDRINREGIYVIDEVLGNEERRQRWMEKEKERMERIEREERRRDARNQIQEDNSNGNTEHQPGDRSEICIEGEQTTGKGE